MADRPFNNPFGKIAGIRPQLVPSKAVQSAEDFPESPPEGGPERALIRIAEREGETVTVIEELGLSGEALESWRMALQRGLATKVSVEGGTLVLAGDHRFKLPDLLLRRGVRRVMQG